MDAISMVSPLFHQPIEELLPVNKGFSSNKKYKVKLQDGTCYFIKIGGIDSAEKKKEEFHFMERFIERGVAVPAPIEVYIIETHAKCVQVFSFIEGTDGEEKLPCLPETYQYEIGVEAGKALAKIHSISLDSPSHTWMDYRYGKYQRYLRALKEVKNIPIDLNMVNSFIMEHKHLLENRPLVFNHGDFHPSNLMVSDKGLEAVIDFERFDWEDPYHEFYKMALFSRNVSVPFSVGQIHGYFGGDPPEVFWNYYALYAAMVFSADIVWANRMTPALIEHSFHRLKTILRGHDNFRFYCPKWYSSYVGERSGNHV
ncbi:aminoglycoside phosphotransferase family protein [Thalassobacillus pellis]|uniref:aminoglycoside phosphotransferase family protein n=1 Tax=Thalassobacillus pellis TaxID=748008 RepID=UPI001960A1B3|nr:aminoglycoside phosphotransferase family protein [Thalassobacillus pellis]MBM7554350.1 aminoglycoside phosphotransferase (APT) family kinase protein [Thalassobacillus pellis]